MRSNFVGLLIFALLGCASGGTSGGEGNVSVYRTVDAVPCDYELIQTVEATCTISNPSRLNMNTECPMARVLGEAGARVGADAVIVAEPEFPARLPFTVEGRPLELNFEGQAVRYLDPTCGQGF